MASDPTRTAAETVYRDIERRRRLRLVRFLAPTFAILQGLTLISNILALIAAPPRSPSTYLGYLGSAICFVLLTIGALVARREGLNIAAACIIVASGIAIISPSFGWIFTLGVTPAVIAGIASYSVLIILVGVLTGNIWLTLATTVLTNVVAGASLYFGPPAQSVNVAAQIQHEMGIILPLSLAIQWAFALLLIAALRIYNPTFRELGDIRIAYERLQQIDELKEQFITNVNHELRNPVMTLQGFLELLWLTSESATPERRRVLIRQANGVSNKLRALIQSILEARSIEDHAAQFIPQPVNVRDAIIEAASLVNSHEAPSPERELRLQVPSSVLLWGDRVRFQQIVTNLLSNAVKYSAPGTPIEIAALPLMRAASWRRADEQTGEYLELRVRDWGLGVPREQVPLLFQRFVRLPRDLASPITGNGLGLYLCRVYTEAMGGTIWCESVGIPGQGTTFIVRLPLAHQLPETSRVPSVPMMQ